MGPGDPLGPQLGPQGTNYMLIRALLGACGGWEFFGVLRKRRLHPRRRSLLL